MGGCLKTMHLFAGVGGGLLADLILGHKPVIAVEWDKYACQVLRERAADGWFPGLSVWEGDITLFDPSEYAGKLDCIHAGFPCQDISVAGKQAGLGEGTRSGLYREVLRIAGIIRPKYLFLENVSAILSNGLGVVLGDLAALGYDCRWCCLRASDVGAPHGRDRWFALAELADTLRVRQPGQRQSIHASNQSEGGEGQASNALDVRVGSERATLAGVGELAYGIPASIYPYWWDIEPDIGRVTNISTNRAARLKGLGNAQVPLQAALAWRILTNG